jgi:hypothetical protein
VATDYHSPQLPDGSRRISIFERGVARLVAHEIDHLNGVALHQPYASRHRADPGIGLPSRWPALDLRVVDASSSTPEPTPRRVEQRPGHERGSPSIDDAEVCEADAERSRAALTVTSEGAVTSGQTISKEN